MICKIKGAIKKYSMLSGGETVAVGVSGGADSVCLLHALCALREEYGIKLLAVHVNHGIRGREALRDENFVRGLCEKLGVKLEVFSADVPALAKETGLGLEECGRKVRYELFESTGADAVAVAHTLSDSIETALFNFARGTGLRGVCGIPPKRDKIIRPLIECTRAQVEKYCEENSLLFVTDSTNNTDDYARNKIRHGAVPALCGVNAEFSKCALRFFETAAAENEYIELQAKALIEESKTDCGYSAAAFQNAHPALGKRAVALLVAPKLSKPAENRHIELCMSIISKGGGKAELSKDLYICVRGGIISFQSKEEEIPEWSARPDGFFAETPVGGFSLQKADLSSLEKNELKNCLDADKLKNRLVFRSRFAGDSFCDPKRKNTKTLKKLFNEAKIPPEKRNGVAVLDCEGKIAWLEGFGASAEFAAGPETKNVFIVKKKGRQK